MRHLDLFAGIGGFHAAVSHLGGETVAAVESNYAVANAYKEMWGLEALGDVVDSVNAMLVYNILRKVF